MNQLQRGIITLMKSAVTGKAYALPEDFNLQEALPTVQAHNILSLCYVGAANCGIPKTEPVMQKLFLRYCAALQHSEGQMARAQTLFRAFEDHGIDYMPVKGCNMKQLYPAPELRPMGDADILIRMEQYPEIRIIMASLGFTFERESDHELIWTSDRLLVELHKRLIDRGNRDFYRYYGDGWDKATRHEGHRYAMSHEDAFIYLFTHFAMHYRYGGVGCRHLLDLWVYLRSYPELDRRYIAGELDKLHLSEFYENVCRTLQAWFEDQPMDSCSEIITDFVFRSGSWGSFASHEIAKGVKYAEVSGKGLPVWLRRYMTALFPSAAVMKRHYPLVGRWPVLLPFSWPVYWVETLLFRQKNIRNCVHGAALMTDSRVSDVREKMNAVGLGYHFKA